MSNTKRIVIGDRVKAAKRGGERAIEGFVSNDVAEVDRQGEVVDQYGLMRAWGRVPHGALPLLWQHDPAEPIGTLSEATLENGRVHGRAALLPEGVSPKADLAWSLLNMEAAAPLGFSIGFRPLKELDDPAGEMDPTGVFRWRNLDWLETSVVSVPAAASSLAVAVKAFECGADYTRPWLPAEEQAVWADQVQKAAQLADVRRQIEQARAKSPRWRDGHAKRAERGQRSAVELTGAFERAWYAGSFMDAAREALEYREQHKGEPLSGAELVAMAYLYQGAQHDAQAARIGKLGVTLPKFPDFDTWRKREGLA